uniref:J domain-containing protein n=1 Tax=Trichuris muris TaxID=70415 RepID=A0A5S6Q7L9_TRIMR
MITVDLRARTFHRRTVAKFSCCGVSPPMGPLAALSFLLTISAALKDPYETLEIQRGASPEAIKRAYKRLAKIWHPDKNADPEANRRFIDINEAYQYLTNPNRRRTDQFGSRGSAHAFADFGHFSYQFAVPFQAFTKLSVDFRFYQEHVLPNSRLRPHVIFFYSGVCLTCISVEPVWEEVVKTLASNGVLSKTVNAMFEGKLAEELRVTSIPSVVILYNDDVHRCSVSLRAQDYIDCVRRIFPSELVVPVKGYDDFASFHRTSVNQNKVSVIVLGNDGEPTLLSLVIASQFFNFCRFGYVGIGGTTNGRHQRSTRFGNIPIRQSEAGGLMIFKESAEWPAVNEPLNRATVAKLVKENKLLSFPRLSSQLHFDAVCGHGTEGPSEKLCILLLVSRQPSDKFQIDAYSRYLHTLSPKGALVSHCYVYAETQGSFLRSFLTAADEKNLTSGRDFKTVVLLRRQGKNRAQFRLLSDVWNARDDHVNQSVHQLTQETELANRYGYRLDRWATLAELRDENGPGVYHRLAKNLVKGVRQFLKGISKEEALPVVSVVATFAVIFLFGGLLHYAANADEQSPNRSSPSRSSLAMDKPAVLSRLIRELRAETYFGMVRLLKPGCRTLVVLCDANSKDTLVSQFGDMIWPWRRNKTLMFGYLMLERNIDWFRQLLELTVADTCLANINPRNVVGTVLALNGFRQYYCIYHPKYRSSLKGYRPSKNRDKQTRYFRSMEMGSDETDTSEEERLEEKHLDEVQKKKSFKVEELLEGLPNWLDRLFDGNVKRFHISEWPPVK